MSRPRAVPTLGDAVVGVIGAGTMGAGIAQVAAWAGHSVVLYDVAEVPVERGLTGLSNQLRRGAERGRHTMAEAEAAINRVETTTDLTDLDCCAIVIEAAPERLELKQDLFSALEAIVAEDAILATNTSTLSVAAIFGALPHQERCCGLHFFNPAPQMPLVEVVRSARTSAATLEFATSLVASWGKTAIVVADTPGFIVNRVARPFYGEALRLLGEGVGDVETIDRLARDAGFVMGPFELMDLIGIDVNFAAAQSVFDGFFGDPRFRPHPIQRSMVESGRLGKKTGVGYYRYDTDGQKEGPA